VLAKARERHPQLAGLLIGDGSIRAELEARARELGLDGHLFFVQGRDHLWVSQALAAATLVLAPMAGLTLTEAALARAPIVAYDYEWHGELIADGETGVLVPYRDTDAMAAAACALLDDPERAARLGVAARAAALQRMQGDAALAHERALAERLLSPSAS
jgi:glycosyltransferase involved in cell wall biosynthesis